MIAAPAKVAQDIADLCVKGGVRAILNYAPINLAVPEACACSTPTRSRTCSA